MNSTVVWVGSMAQTPAAGAWMSSMVRVAVIAVPFWLMRPGGMRSVYGTYNACARTYIPVGYGAAVKKEDPGVEAFGAFLRAHAVVLRRLEDDLEGEAGVPLGWYDVLLTLERAPGRRLRMQELGDAVVLSRSRVSRIVDELERQGFVSREPCETDRRVVYASITRPGRVALRHAIPSHLRAIDAYFSSLLTEDELVTIRRALTRVAEQTTPAR